jgi:hypothetical protein
VKWATGENLGTVRPACVWLIRRFIDPDAEFLFFPKERVLAEAAAVGAKTFHLKGAGDYPTSDARTTFCVLMDRHELWGRDPALDFMARLLEKGPAAGDTSSVIVGVRALVHGFQDSIPDDRAKLVHLVPMYEALYRWCGRKVRGVE